MLRSLRTGLSGLAVVAASLAGQSTALASADNFPDRPIRFVVPYNAGGGSDVVARRIAEHLGKRLSTSIIVENRPGAAGVIGTNAVVRSKPDGYTYALVSGTHLLNPFIQPQMPYDTAKDLVGVTLIARIPLVFVTQGTSAATDMASLFTQIKQAPNRYSMASAENYMHLLNAIITTRQGLDLTNVPYSGAAPMLIDIASGVTTFGPTSVMAAFPHFQSGRLKPLAVTGSKRSSVLPDVPTVAEQGLGEFEFYNGYSLYAPAGTPMAILNRMQQEIHAVLQEPAVREMLDSQAAEPVGNSTEAFNEQVASELAAFETLTKQHAITQ